MESCSASADTNRHVYMYLYIHLVGPHLEGERRISALLFPLLHPAHAPSSSASATLRENDLRLRHDFGLVHEIFSTCAPACRSPPRRHREPRTRQFHKVLTCAWYKAGSARLRRRCRRSLFRKKHLTSIISVSVSVKKTILISHG